MNSRKRILSILLGILLMLSVLPAVSLAEDAATPTISLVLADPNAEIHPGDAFAVNAVIANNPSISGFQARIEFDQTAMELTKITRVNYLCGADEESLFTSKANYIEHGAGLNVAWVSDAGTAEDGVLFQLQFKAKAEATEATYSIAFDREDGGDFKLVHHDGSTLNPNTTPCTLYLGTPSYGIFARSGEAGAYKYTEVTDTDFMLNTASNLDVAPWKDTATLVLMNGIKVVDNAQWTIKDETVVQKDADAAEEAGAIHLKATGSTPGSTTELTVTSGDTTLKCNVKIANYARAITNASMKPLYGDAGYVVDRYVVSTSRKLNMVTPMTDVAGNAITDTANAGEITWKTTGGQSDMRVFVNEQGELESLIQQTYSYERCTATPVVKGYVDGVPVELEGNTLNIYLNPQSAEALTVLDANGKIVPSTYEVDGALYPLYTIPADGVRRELKVVGAPEGPKEKAGTNVQVKGATSENEEALTVGGGYQASQTKSFLGLTSSTPRETPYRVAVRFTDSWDGSTTGARLERTAYIYVKVREPVKAETIALDQTELSMMETRKVTLTATLTPADNDYPEITWESADKTIATVDSKGTVTAVKAGETTITATNTRADGTTVTATCTVTVTPIDYTDAKLCIRRGGEWDELNLAEGQELLLANRSSYDYWTKSTYLGFMLKDGQIGPDLKYKLTMDADSKAASTQLVQSNKNGQLYLNPQYENSRACGGTLEISTPNDEVTVTLRLRRGPLPVNYGMTYKYETAHGNEYLMYGTGDEKVLVVPDGFVLDLNNDLGYTDATGGAQTTTLAGEMPYADIQWTADDPSVAAIGEDGKVTFHTGETRMHLKVSAFVAAEQVTHDEYQTLRVVVNGNYATGAKLQLNGRDLAVNDSYRDGEDVIKVATVYVGTKTPVTLNVVPLPEGSNTIAVNSVTIEEGFQSSSPRNISASVDKDNNTVVLQGLKANTGLQRLWVSVKFNNPDNEDYYTKSYVLYARVVNTVTNLLDLTLEDVITVKVGGTEEVEPEFTPASASDKAVTWSIEDETIATVDENGVVTGIKEGETKLTCTSVSFPDVTATCTVRVVFDSTGYTIAARGTNENGETVYNPIGESNPLILNTKTVEPWKSTAELYLLNATGEICGNVEWSVAEGSELRKAETQPENGFAIDATGLADGTTTAVSVAHRNVTFTCPVQVKDYYFTATSAPSFDIKAPFIGQVQGNELFANTNSGHTFTFTLKDELTAAQKAAQTLEFVPSVEGGGTSTANSDGTYTFAVGNGEYDFTLNVHATGSRDGAPYSASLSSAAAFKCHVGASIPAKVGFEQPNIYGTFTGLYNYQTVTINNLVNSKLCKVSGNAYVGLATQGETTEFKIVATPEESQSQVTINSIVATDSSDMTFERTGDQSFAITMSDTAPSGKVIGSVTVTGTRVVNGKTYTFKQPMYVQVKSGNSVEYFSINAPKSTIEVGETMQLTTVIKPRLAANAYVYWQSSDPSVVSVDQNGLVTGSKEGSFVRVTATAGSKTSSVYITVKAKGTPKAVMSTDLEEGAKLKPGDTFHLYVDLVNVPASGFDAITAQIRPSAWKKTPYFTAAAGSTENLLGSDVEGYAPKLEYNLNGGNGPTTWMAVMELDMSASESNITGDGRLMDILVTVGKDAQKATDTVYEFNPSISGWSCDGTAIKGSYKLGTSIIVEGAGSASKPTAVTIGSDSASSVACVDDTITLAANVAPAGASQTVVWSTEDTDIISIASADEVAANSMEVTANRIKVTALKEGTATVTATAGEVSTTYTLTIVEKQIGLTAAIDGTQTIDKGETANVRVRIDSDNAEETYNAFELIVSYDKDKLTYAGSDADDSANRFVKDNEDGTLTIYGYGDSITAGTELATLQFTGTAAGEADVALTSAKANESDVAIKDDLQTINISAAQKNAVVTVVNAVTVTFEGGTVNGGKTRLLVENGELSFTVDPVEGKDVQSVLVNGAALQPNAQGVYELSGVTEDTTVTITFKDKTYTVKFDGNGKDDVKDPVLTAKHLETYNFELNEQAGYQYSIEVKVDGKVLDGVTGTTIPGRYVTGDIVITITKEPSAASDYSVKVWRNGAEQKDEETTVTKNANEYRFQYDAAKWKLMKVTMGGTEVAVADDNGSVTVNGPITGNLAIYYAGIYKVTLPETGVSADKDSVIYGEDFTFTVDDGYTIDKVTIDGKEYTPVDNGDGTFTIKGEDITGDVVITVIVPEYQVEVYEYVKLENKASVMLIVAKADLAEGKALYYDGGMMFHSNADAYDGYAYLQIIGEGETLTKEDAAKKITQSAGTPVEIDYGGDVNMSQRTDLNDAQLAYDIYMAKYNSLDGQVSMEKFLRADVNVDHCVDATDARAIADDVYQK